MWQEPHPSVMRRRTLIMLPMKKTLSTREHLRRKELLMIERKALVTKDERVVRAEAVMVLMEIAGKTAATDLMSR